MNKRHLLWILLAAHVLLTFASVGSEAFFSWTLPSVLSDYSHARFAASPFTSSGGVFQLFLMWGASCVALAAWISLAFLWRWARRLYVVSWVLGTLLILFSGAQVDTSMSAMFQEMSAVVGGVILGLIYFSDLARHFERAPAARAVPMGLDMGAHRA